ncbi:MAG TPA: hypothetical protein VNG13_09255 [Mycobacteriales bacterium]|nr:hypothetical protein [Mycobacteriales bacterium]
MSQLSFFSAESMPPSPLDVEGLLAGPAQIARRGSEARLSVVVSDEPWRVVALLTGLRDRGLEPETVPSDGAGTIVVRTAFSRALHPLADRWAVGAVKRPPVGFVLDGSRLRWWCLSAGSGGPLGYTLVLGKGDQSAWPALGAALSAVGVPAALVRPRGAGPVYRVVGRRRLARLRELVGEPPDGAPGNAWPMAGS